VLVTGGGSGIGRCTAHELASLGADLALVGRKMEKLETVKAEIEQTCSVKISLHSCDIREEDRVRETVADVLAAHGKINHLINNAGGQFPSPLNMISGKGFETVVRNNLTGGFLMAREVFNQYMMLHLGEADMSITNIIADMWNGMPGMGHSGAARAGMLNFSETASNEWAPVRVNAVAPGYIETEMTDSLPDKVKEGILGQVPLGRMGQPKDIARTVGFLAHPESDYITGQVLNVDGGML